MCSFGCIRISTEIKTDLAHLQLSTQQWPSQFLCTSQPRFSYLRVYDCKVNRCWVMNALVDQLLMWCWIDDGTTSCSVNWRTDSLIIRGRGCVSWLHTRFLRRGYLTNTRRHAKHLPAYIIFLNLMLDCCVRLNVTNMLCDSEHVQYASHYI